MMRLILCLLMAVFFALPTQAKRLNRVDQALDKARVHTNLSSQYYQVGQIATAVDEAQVALRSVSDYVPAHTVLALIYAQLHQNDLADAHFAQALKASLEQRISQTDLRNSYAWYLCSTGRENDALKEFSLVLRDPLYDSLGKSLTNAGVCAARMKRLDLAMPYLNAAIDGGVNNGVAYIYRAHLFINDNQYLQAQADLHQAEGLMMELPELVWLRVRLESAQESSRLKDTLKELIVKFPASEQANWARAKLYDVF